MSDIRFVYLVRHGKPDFEGGVQRCIGCTDVGLSPYGQIQARDLAVYFNIRKVNAIYSSPLRRARQTAEFISKGRYPIETIPGLEEIDCGEWENLTMTEIQDKYPELHAERAVHPDITLPGGESMEHAAERFIKAFTDLVHRTEGEIAVVAHSAVNRLFMCHLMGRPYAEWRTIPQPYACINVLEVENDEIRVASVGRMPKSAPSHEQCEYILRKYHTSEDVIAHCLVVAAVADTLASQLRRAGNRLDSDVVHAAAMLHDIAYGEENHDKIGAQWIMNEGYPSVATVIAGHHDAQKTPMGINAVEVVYLADKMVLGTQEISMEERFNRSRHRCKTPEDRAEHERRYALALDIQKRMIKVIQKADVK